MSLTRLTPIDGEAIISLADCKLHIRVQHTDEDTLIGSLRDAACEHVERVSGVALASASYLWEGSSFARIAALPMRPVTALGAVVYNDAVGVEAAYATARLVNGVAYPAVADTWPVAYDYAAITFTAGATCPPDLLAAVKLMLGHLYMSREAVSADGLTSVPMGVDALIGTYRAVLV